MAVLNRVILAYWRGKTSSLATAGAIAAALAISLPSAHAQSGTAAGETGVPGNPPLSTVEDMEHVANDLDHIKASLDLISPAVNNDKFRQINDFVGYTQDFTELALALRQDIAEHRDPSTDSSHTVEELAKIETEFVTKTDRLDDLAKLGLITETAARRLGYFSFGAGDIAEGVGKMIGAKTLMNPDTAETVLDGIAKTAWGIYGYAESFGNWEVAQAYSAAAGMAAKSGRDLTLPFMQHIIAQANGTDQTLISIYERAQQQRVAQGKARQTIEEFYGRDAATLNMIGESQAVAEDARMGVAEQFQQRTFEHYRETCVAGNCTRTDLLHSPVAPPDHPLGGVLLDRPLTGAALRGVKIDFAHGNIILLGERDFLARGINLRDFAMALWLVFGPDAQDPAFSLDPADTRNPRGPWLSARYIPDILQGRSFGAEMFAADLRLKELSFQTMLRGDGKLQAWKSTVPGFHSYADLAMKNEQPGNANQQWSRFWIVASQVTARRAGNTLLFNARMAVKARREVPDPHSPTGLRDIDTDPNSLEASWARIATADYDSLAAESPVLARVRDLAVAIAIAKSLKAAGAHVSLTRVADLLNGDRTRTISRIQAFSVSWQSRSETPFHQGDREGVRIETRELRLFGGVDLSVTPKALPDAGGVALAVDTAVGRGFQLAGPMSKIIHYGYGRSRFEAIALPLLSSR